MENSETNQDSSTYLINTFNENYFEQDLSTMFRYPQFPVHCKLNFVVREIKKKLWDFIQSIENHYMLLSTYYGTLSCACPARSWPLISKYIDMGIKTKASLRRLQIYICMYVTKNSNETWFLTPLIPHVKTSFFNYFWRYNFLNVAKKKHGPRGAKPLSVIA